MSLKAVRRMLEQDLSMEDGALKAMKEELSSLINKVPARRLS
jgi:hypothetical protein